MTASGTGPRDTQCTVYHGRRWFAIYLWVLAAASAGLALTTPLLGWFAVATMGITLALSAYVCLTIGWGEMIARIELGDDGFSLLLPSYRGYFPFWPAQRLEGKWSEVSGLSRQVVRARILGIRYDYFLHRIDTRTGHITLFEALPNDFFSNTRGGSLNLPIAEVAREFARRSGISPTSEGEAQGGGLWRNLTAP